MAMPYMHRDRKPAYVQQFGFNVKYFFTQKPLFRTLNISFY